MIGQVANRYAEAIFELAEEENKTTEIFSELEQIAKTISENANLYDALRSPFVSRDDKKSIVDKVFYDGFSSYTKNLIKVLIDNGRTTEFASIVDSFKNMLNDKEKVAEGVVITAIPLSNEKISELEIKISARYNRSVKLVNKIDESILGGVLVRIGNEEIDGTVKARLDGLKEQLSQVIS